MPGTRRRASCRGISESDTLVVERRIPFSSATKFSGVVFSVGGVRSSWLLGAPERLLGEHPEQLARANTVAATGQRTLALVRALDPLPTEPHASIRGVRVEPAQLVVFEESVRPAARATLGYFRKQAVRVWWSCRGTTR